MPILPSEPPPPINLAAAETWVGYALVAFMGSFLRAARWQDEKGKIVWTRVMFEVPIAIAISSVAGGLGAYMHWEGAIVYGLCGVLGLVGPAFFTGLGEAILSVIKSRYGKP